VGASRGSQRGGCKAVALSKGGRQIIDFIRIHGKDMQIDWKGGSHIFKDQGQVSFVLGFNVGS
jgi:hypothetical protein